MTTKKYAAVLFLDHDTNLEAIRLSESLGDQAVTDPLSETKRLPHLTLMMAMLDQEALMTASERIDRFLRAVDRKKRKKKGKKRITHGMNPPKGTFTNFKAYGPAVFLAEPQKKLPKLSFWHRRMRNMLSSLRVGNVPSHYELGESDRKLQQKFGYHRVMWRFHPHVTLGRLKEVSPVAVAEKVRVSWRAVSLALVEMDEYGVIADESAIVKEWRLGAGFGITQEVLQAA